MVALRWVITGFSLTAKLTAPLPFPVPVPVTTSQDALLEAAHAQPAGADTAMPPLPEPAPIVWLAGDSVYVQVMPLCVIVNVRPSTTMVPVRGETLALAATVNATLPLPLPEDVVSVIHEEEVVAVQVQPAWAVTDTVPLAPDAAIDWPVGVRL
jgi:hypothetical protein